MTIWPNVFRDPNNPANTWKNINKLLRKSKPKSVLPNAIKIDNETITDHTEICNKLNNHFVSIGQRLSTQI